MYAPEIVGPIRPLPVGRRRGPRTWRIPRCGHLDRLRVDGAGLAGGGGSVVRWTWAGAIWAAGRRFATPGRRQPCAADAALAQKVALGAVGTATGAISLVGEPRPRGAIGLVRDNRACATSSLSMRRRRSLSARRALTGGSRHRRGDGPVQDCRTHARAYAHAGARPDKGDQALIPDPDRRAADPYRLRPNPQAAGPDRDDYTFENVRRCAQAVGGVRGRLVASRPGGSVIAYDRRFAQRAFAAAAAEVIVCARDPDRDRFAGRYLWGGGNKR